MTSSGDMAAVSARSVVVGLVTAGLASVLLVATLGEGGGFPTSLVFWHGGLVVLAAVFLVMGGRVSGLDRGPQLALTVFVLLFTAGAVRVEYDYAALLVSLELGACLLAAYLAVSVGPSLLESLVWPLRIGAALQGALGIAQWAANLGGERAVGTFYNPNHLGLWLVAVLLLSFGTGADGLRARVGLVLTALPAAVAIPLTGSRGAAMGAAVGGVWLIFVFWRRLGHRARTIVVALILVAGTGMVWQLSGRLKGEDPFRYQRLRIWSASLQMVAADPWWGSGPGQFRTTAINLGFPDGDGPLRFDRAFTVSHSDAVRLPTEFGIPAALAMLAALGLAARRLFRLYRDGKLSPAGKGAVAALAAIATHAAVDNPSKWPAVYLLASVLLGALLASRPIAGAGMNRGVRLGLALVLALAFVTTDVAPYLAWRQVNGLSRGRLDEQGVGRLDLALKLNPLHPDYHLRFAEHISADPGWTLDEYSLAREAAERAARIHPDDARYQRGLAWIEARAFRTILPVEETRTRVREHYRRAERLARHDPFAAIGLAAFLIDTGDAVGARRAAERALAIEPGAALPRLLLADAFIESGSPEDLRRAATLIQQARTVAANAPEFTHGAYAERLLRLDPGVVDRLERKIRRATEPEQSDDPTQRQAGS